MDCRDLYQARDRGFSVADIVWAILPHVTTSDMSALYLEYEIDHIERKAEGDESGEYGTPRSDHSDRVAWYLVSQAIMGQVYEASKHPQLE